jgi:hypothetical protein
MRVNGLAGASVVVAPTGLDAKKPTKEMGIRNAALSSRMEEERLGYLPFSEVL